MPIVAKKWNLNKLKTLHMSPQDEWGQRHMTLNSSALVETQIGDNSIYSQDEESSLSLQKLPH
jgi:hypothetical protein